MNKTVTIHTIHSTKPTYPFVDEIEINEEELKLRFDYSKLPEADDKYFPLDNIIRIEIEIEVGHS